jgi:quinol monooxygenase YgiN
MYVIIGGHFDVDPGDKAKFMDIIKAVTAPSVAEAGCVRYAFSQSLDKPNRIHLFEVWKDKAALEEHFKTPHLLKFREDVGKLKITRDITRYTGDELKA